MTDWLPLVFPLSAVGFAVGSFLALLSHRELDKVRSREITAWQHNAEQWKAVAATWKTAAAGFERANATNEETLTRLLTALEGKYPRG